MSHFTVAIIHKENQDIESLLAPYNENMKVEPYISRTKEEMIADGRKIKARIEEEGLTPNTEKWVKKYLEAKTDEDFWQVEKSVYYYTYDEDGNELTTYNPDSKWDWWVVGGRWSGEITTKDGKEVNSAKIADIDFSINEEEYKKNKRFWEIIVDGDEPRTKEEEEQKKWTWYKKEYYTNRYEDADDYANRASQFATYAVVTPDGVWHEKGQMGWWGMSTDTAEDAKGWDANYYNEFIAPYDPNNTYVTVVDCHI